MKSSLRLPAPRYRCIMPSNCRPLAESIGTDPAEIRKPFEAISRHVAVIHSRKNIKSIHDRHRRDFISRHLTSNTSIPFLPISAPPYRNFHRLKASRVMELPSLKIQQPRIGPFGVNASEEAGARPLKRVSDATQDAFFFRGMLVE